MIRILFKNLKHSELAKRIVEDRIEQVFSRFPDLVRSRVTVTLSMENSPSQPGPDRFHVKLRINGGRYNGIILEKDAANLYLALAEVDEHLLERLNRFGDKQRIRERKQSRRLSNQF